MARPRITQPKRKTQQIIFRVTSDEYDFLSAVARRAGLSVNALSRHSTLSKSKRILIKRVQSANPALINQLQRIGVNLNQIARRVNQSGRVFHTLLPLCEELERIINKEISE